MKLGFIYPCGHRFNYYVGTYVVLKQFRKIYPEAPMVMWEDCHTRNEQGECKYPLKEIAEEFNITHYGNGFDHRHPGKNTYAVDLDGNIEFFRKAYEACQNELVECEWVMLFEDDVWIQREVVEYPKTQDYTGILVNGANIMKRTAIIKAYERFPSIDWNTLLEEDPLARVHTDHFIKLVFDNINLKTVEYWKERSEFSSTDIIYNSAVFHAMKIFMKEPYGVLKQHQNTTKDISDILKHPEVEKFKTNYQVTVI